MEQNIHFERCVDFLARMIEKYGNELLFDEQMEAKEHPTDTELGQSEQIA